MLRQYNVQYQYNKITMYTMDNNGWQWMTMKFDNELGHFFIVVIVVHCGPLSNHCNGLFLRCFMELACKARHQDLRSCLETSPPGHGPTWSPRDLSFTFVVYRLDARFCGAWLLSVSKIKLLTILTPRIDSVSHVISSKIHAIETRCSQGYSRSMTSFILSFN